MKRAISLTLAIIVMALSLVSCGEASEASSVQDGATSSATAASDAVPSQAEPVIPAVNNYERITYGVPDIEDYIQITGRPVYSDVGAVMDQSGSGVRFRLDCEGDVNVTMNVNVRGTYCPNRYYTVIVDGTRTDRVKLEAVLAFTGKYTLPLATGLARGEHTFEIYRATPSAYGAEDVAAIECNGVPIDPPERKKLFIEFLGDSITAGLISIDPTGASDAFSSDYADGVQTYSFYAADRVGAEYSSVCRGGQPFTVEYGGVSVSEFYSLNSQVRDLGEYDFSRTADVVVINLGTNDFNASKMAENGVTLETAQRSAVELLTYIREKNPTAKIVWAYGISVNTNSEVMKKAIDQMGGEKSGFYFCAMPDTSDGHGHPYIDGHERAGEFLADFFESKLGIKAVK